MMAGAVSAKGPAGSFGFEAVCDTTDTGTGGTMDVTIFLDDISSGIGVPTVNTWHVDGMAKVKSKKWTDQVVFDQADGTGAEVESADFSTGHDFRIDVELDLCKLQGVIAGLSPGESLKAINALVEVEYDRGNDTTRTTNFRCGDDPETLDVVEPDGIMITPTILGFLDDCPIVP